MLGTGLCDRCWELEQRIQADPELALRILKTISPLTTSVDQIAREILEHGIDEGFIDDRPEA